MGMSVTKRLAKTICISKQANMNMMTINKSILAAALSLSLAQMSDAAVTMYFEQVGSDVKISAEGTLDVNINSSSIYTAEELISFWGPSNLTILVMGDVLVLNVSGADSATTLINGSNALESGISSFGFLSYNTIYVDSNDLEIGGGVGGADRITWNAEEHHLIIVNKSLSTMGANSFDNTLAWTDNTTGDEIRYQTGSPSAVPEPSSCVLLGLGAFGLFLRRRG